LITEQLSGYRDRLQGIVVESTYNWYWLVDGLMEHGHRVHLANTAAIQQYAGLKYTDDHSDARWLAHILRLGVLPQGYIYPKEERAVRDLLRKRSQMVRQRTTNLLSIQNLITRNTGSSLNGNRIKTLSAQQVDELLANPDLALAVKANLALMSCADEQINLLERTVSERIKLRAEFCFLKISHGGGLCLVLPLCRESEVKQRQEKRPGQYQERQQAFGLGVCRGGQFRHPLLFSDQEFLSQKESQEPWGIGAQSGGAQVVPSLLLHHETSGPLRCDQGVCLREDFTAGMGQ
jgi:hypothetical protein